MVAAAICAGAVTASVPVIMTGVAFAADQKLELPNWLAVKLPGIGEVNLPKLPEMPSLPELPAMPKGISLPKIGGAGKKSAEPIFIDDNPNVTATTAPPKPKVRVGKETVPVPQAPTLDELKKAAGKNATGGVSIATGVSSDSYRRFPVRRLPGKNMSSFLDMAKDL